VNPQYPEQARAEGVQGTVLLRTVISVSGQPVSLTALNNLVDGRLVAAATEAVSQWRYQPTLLNGQPVEVATIITVGFQLRH
jgi:TonB family protein